MEKLSNSEQNEPAGEVREGQETFENVSGAIEAQAQIIEQTAGKYGFLGWLSEKKANIAGTVLMSAALAGCRADTSAYYKEEPAPAKIVVEVNPNKEKKPAKTEPSPKAEKPVETKKEKPAPKTFRKDSNISLFTRRWVDGDLEPDTQVVQVDKNAFAVDLGGRDFNCYLVDEDALKEIRQIEQNLKRRYSFITSKNPRTRNPMTQDNYEKAANIQKERFIRQNCEKMSRNDVPEKIRKAQNEREQKLKKDQREAKERALRYLEKYK